MPPVFKKPKEYDPELAKKTMQLTGTLPKSSHLDEDRRQMLVDLGLADDGELSPTASDEDEDTEQGALTAGARNKQAAQAESAGSGSIGAFYPEESLQSGSTRYIQELQARTAQAVQHVQGRFGSTDPATANTVQTLLLELQRQVEVQQRGQDSLRNSMGALRRRTKEAEERRQQLEAEQEEQQQAIRRVNSMNDKLQAALNAAARAKLQLAEASAQLQARTGELAQSKKDVQQLHAEAASAAAALDTERATSARLQQALSAAQSGQQLKQSAGEEELQQQLQQSQQQLQQHQGQLQQQQGQLRLAQDEIQHLQQQLSAAKVELSSSQQQLEAARTSSRSSGEQSSAQSQQLAALTANEQRLQQRVAELERELAASKQEAQHELASALQRCAAQEDDLTRLRAQAERLNMNQSDLQQQCAAEAEGHRHAQAQLAAVTREREALAEESKRAAAQQGLAAEQLQALVAKQSEASARVAALRAERDGLQERLVAANTEAAKNARKAADELAALRATSAAAQQALAQVQSQYEQRVAALQQEADQQVLQYKQQWRVEFDKRRKLHNQIIEFKGNIRVLARIRPLLGKELANEAAATTSQGSTALPVEARSEETIVLNAPAGAKEFEFDRVFQQQEGQEQVFDEVAPLVTSVLDGYNVCIIAYGQTGSGKTHTMEGPQDNPGVNTRALRELFRAAEERSSEMSFSFAASVLEIYQEQIFDLLSGSRDTGDKLDVKEGPEGMHVPGLRQEAVVSLDEVSRVLQKGKQNRTTFATNMNEHSSRSHLVVSLNVKAQELKTGASWHAKLHLIDLAGSERLSRSGAQGERLKEAQAINKSLSALGDVISALQQRSAHVPYRNSKLTRLLEDSLGSNSKCIMFVNCSPAAENVGETKCSLEFAARARKVELGAAKRNLNTSPNFAAQREARDTTISAGGSSRDLSVCSRELGHSSSTLSSGRATAATLPAPPPGGPSGGSGARPRPPAAAAPAGAAAFRRPMPGMQ